MQSTSSKQQPLETLNRLPTGFFPSPPEKKQISERRIIVVAYDHSNYGDAMIAKCINMGLIRADDDIRILHIISQQDYRTLFAPMLSGSGTSGGIRHEDLASSMEHAAGTLVYEIINVLKKQGFEHITSEIMRGDPKLSITDYCRMTKPTYLLTGTRGFGAVKRAVLGSVSDFLVNHCPCPVLIIKLEPSEIEARKELNEQKKANFNHVLASFNKSKN